MVLTDVFNSPAVPLLVELETQGFALGLTPTGRVRVEPGSRLTTDQRQILVTHAADVVTLLRVCDEGVQARRVVFEDLIANRGDVLLPALIYMSGLPYAPGVCYSCGDHLDASHWGRCWRCSFAARLATAQTIPAGTVGAYDAVRTVA